jgi:signal transduction histidine kinase
MSLDNAKTEFLNTVSNDIRNPLNNILDIVHLLKDFVDSKTIFHLITNLDKSVKKLEAYSGMAILISELRTNKYQGQFTKVLASEFIDFCFEDLITEIMAKNITLRKPEVNNQIALMADTDLLLKGTRILLDLLISGLDSAGKIDVDVKQNRDIILIKVEKSQSDGQTITHSSVNSEERLEFTFMQLILDYHRGKFEVLENQDGFAGFTMQLPVK